MIKYQGLTGSEGIDFVLFAIAVTSPFWLLALVWGLGCRLEISDHGWKIINRILCCILFALGIASARALYVQLIK